MSSLVRPSSRHKDSYIAALREFHKEGRYTYHNIDRVRLDFDSLLADESARIHDENIAAYQVPETIFWLVDDGEFIGRLELRHELNEHLFEIGGHIGYAIRPSRRGEGYGNEILELGLEKACEVGLQQVLLTCDPDNTPSKKIIEKNGGDYENRIDVEREGIVYHKLRYWIDVPRQIGADAGQCSPRSRP